MELGEGIKKILLAGIGTAAVTAEKSKEVLDELVKKGELTVEQGKCPQSGTEAQYQREREEECKRNPEAVQPGRAEGSPWQNDSGSAGCPERADQQDAGERRRRRGNCRRRGRGRRSGGSQRRIRGRPSGISNNIFRKRNSIALFKKCSRKS